MLSKILLVESVYSSLSWLLVADSLCMWKRSIVSK